MKLTVVIKMMVNATQALLDSINRLEDMVEWQRTSLQLFIEENILTHHVKIEDTLDDLKEEIPLLLDQVSALDVSPSTRKGN